MDGYELVTSDEARLGHVVGRLGDSIVVEHGLLRKRRHAVPLAFVTADDDARVVRTTVSKEIVESSPEVGEGDVDEAQIAAYYGLARPEDEPATAGYGALAPGDPALTADQQARSHGLTAAEEERARIREELSQDEGRLDRGESPGMTGGDRYRDADT